MILEIRDEGKDHQEKVEIQTKPHNRISQALIPVCGQAKNIFLFHFKGLHPEDAYLCF